MVAELYKEEVYGQELVVGVCGMMGWYVICRDVGGMWQADSRLGSVHEMMRVC